MATANFEIGNKEFEVRFIPESGYPPTKNERGSSLVEYDVTTYKDNQPMMKKFNQKKRVYFDLEGNVYKDKHSNKVWFNLDYERRLAMIRDDAKIIVTQTGVSLKEALTKEVVKALNKEASIYMNYEIPEVKLGGNPPSGKENRRTRRMLELRKRNGRL